jgi:hypothetical protein
VERSLSFPVFEDEDVEASVDYAERLMERGCGTVPRKRVAGWVKVAVPDLVLPPPFVGPIRVRVAGPVVVDDEAWVGENVTDLVREAFDARRGKILLRAILRALAKWTAKEKVEESEAGRLGGLLVNLVGLATEQADTRGWSLLPGAIALARFRLPPGRYDLHVLVPEAAVIAPGGATVEVVGGRIQFVSLRVLREEDLP